MRAQEAFFGAIGQATMDLLSRFCVVDSWSANLDSAVFSLGETARRFHGLDPRSPRFGLLEFVRCYDTRASYEIINLFEQAAASGRPFQYTAELKSTTPEKRLVHCFGDLTTAPSGSTNGELTGSFSSHGTNLSAAENFGPGQSNLKHSASSYLTI